MPLVAVQTYLKGVLDGLVIPGTAGNLEAFISPPNPEFEATPKAYIWPSTSNENRQSMPRNTGVSSVPGGSAWKELNHLVDVWLVWFSDEASDAQDLDSAFPAVIDAVAWQLRTVPDPAVLTDPMTGRESQLLDVGERMSFEFPPARATLDQRILRYDARIQLEIMEVFQA